MSTAVSEQSSQLEDKPEGSNMYLHQPQSQQNVSHARTFIEHISKLDVDCDPAFVRQTNIACTIGEAWNTREKITEMIKHGTNIIRMNLHLDSYAHCKELVGIIREIEASLNYNPVVAIAFDISTPPVSTGLISNDVEGSITLTDGQFVTLSISKDKKNVGTTELIWIDTQFFPNFFHCISVDDRVHLNDGFVSLIVRDIKYDQITCLIERGGCVTSYSRVIFPSLRTCQKTYENTYKSALLFAAECNVDFVFTGYISRADQIVEARSIIGDEIKLFPKIQTRESLLNLNELIARSDGIIIDRSSLGLNCPIERVSQFQKNIIAKCNIMAKPVFVYGQILESMRFKPRATRAEISDIGNAVLDGADGLILTVETSRGLYPKKALDTLHKTCREAESAVFHEQFWFEVKNCRDIRGLSPLTPAYLSALAAVEASSKCNASAIFVITTSGSSALSIASFRPFCPVVAIVRRPEVARYFHSIRGIHPFVYTGPKLDEWSHDMDLRLNSAIDFARFRGFVTDGDRVVFVTGSKAGAGSTNTVRIVELPSAATKMFIVRSEAELEDDTWSD